MTNSKKHSMKWTQKSLLMLSMIYLSSCTTAPGLKTDFYRANAKKQSITNAKGVEVKCSHQDFNNFACLDKQGIKEMADHIQRERRITKWER